MKIAVVGTVGTDSKLLSKRLDHLISKLNKPIFLYVPPCSKFFENWLFARMHTWQIYHEGLEALLESTDVLVAFGNDKQTRQTIKLAEKKGIKVKRVE